MVFPTGDFSWTTVASVVVLGLLLTGCDLLGGDDDDTVPSSTSIFVANQGNFSDANGSISTFDPQTGTNAPQAIGPDVLGSTVQSLVVSGDRLFVVSNTAGRVDGFDPASLSRTAQSDAVFDNPRYLSVVTENKAYVTDQSFEGPSSIDVLDLSSSDLPRQKQIEVSGSPEQITLAGDRAYVALGAFGATSRVAVVNTNTDELIEEIDIGCNARFVRTDADNDVFAFCNVPSDGDVEAQGEVVVLDGPSGEEQTRLDLSGPVQSASGVTQAAAHAPEIREMFVVVDEQELTRIDTGPNEVVAELGPFEGNPIGAVGFEPTTEQIVLGRVAGFDVSGTVTLHARDGDRTGQFDAGIAPTHFGLRIEE